MGREMAGRFGVCALDPTKVTVKTGDIMTGYQMEEQLWHKWGISVELSAPNHLMLLTTVFDDFDMYGYTVDAFRKVVGKYGSRPGDGAGCPAAVADFYTTLPAMGEGIMPPRQAVLGPTTAVPIHQSAGRVSAALVSVYPPGIPLLCPGEVVTRDGIEYIEYIKKTGGSIVGLRAEEELLVVNDR